MLANVARQQLTDIRGNDSFPLTSSSRLTCFVTSILTWISTVTSMTSDSLQETLNATSFKMWGQEMVTKIN